jgi:hypothetical protein
LKNSKNSSGFSADEGAAGGTPALRSLPATRLKIGAAAGGSRLPRQGSYASNSPVIQ